MDLIKVLAYKENDDEALKKAVEELDEANFNDATVSNKKASLLVFLLTQSYYESELFIEHLEESKNDKNEIFIITNKNNQFKINEDKFKNFEIFKFETVIFKNVKTKAQKKHVNDESTRLTDFFRSNQKVVSDEILFLIIK